MKRAIMIASQGWNLDSEELKVLLGLEDRRSIIKELQRINCPIRQGKYVIAQEFFEALKNDNTSISPYKAQSDSAKKLNA